MGYRAAITGYCGADFLRDLIDWREIFRLLIDEVRVSAYIVCLDARIAHRYCGWGNNAGIDGVAVSATDAWFAD